VYQQQIQAWSAAHGVQRGLLLGKTKLGRWPKGKSVPLLIAFHVAKEGEKRKFASIHVALFSSPHTYIAFSKSVSKVLQDQP
jgi:hypothetical protein